MSATHAHSFLTLCLVTDFSSFSHFTYERYEKFLIEILQAGVTSVQLRVKDEDIYRHYQFAVKIKSILSEFQAAFIINDNVEFAYDIKADGVHLGQSDSSPIQAREKLGINKIIGLSIESLEQLDQANKLKCLDYVSASAIFSSKIKTDCKKIWGLDGLKACSQISHYPVIAIGGITLENIEDVILHGAMGVAIISALQNSTQPTRTTKEFLNKIQGTLNHLEERRIDV